MREGSVRRRSVINWRGFACVAVGAIVACSADDDSSVIDAPVADAPTSDAVVIDVPGADALPWSAECRAYCEHRVACGTTQDLDGCITFCIADFDLPWMRVDTGQAVLACQTALPCGQSNNECVTACVPTTSHETYESQCRSSLAMCGGATWLDRVCETTMQANGSNVGWFCFILPSIMDEMTACIPAGVTCSAAIDCLQGVFTAHQIDP